MTQSSSSRAVESPAATCAGASSEASASFPQLRVQLPHQVEHLYSVLAGNVGKTFGYDELAEILGSQSEYPKVLIGVLVCRLRRHLPKGWVINTVWKRGFVMERVA